MTGRKKLKQKVAVKAGPYIRRRITPKDFINHLRTHLPGFKNLPPGHQGNLAWLIFVSNSKYRQHANPNLPGWIFIPYQELYQNFGKGNFEAINTKLEVFESKPWVMSENQTKPYRLSQKVQEIKNSYVRTAPRKKTYLVDASLRKINSPDGALLSKNNSGSEPKAWKNHKQYLSVRVPVDVENLKNFSTQMLKMADSLTADIYAANRVTLIDNADQARLMIRLANADPGKENCLLHQYSESPEGRLFAMGLNLQGCRREIRKAALVRMHDYDFENCHFSLFHQLAERHGYKAPEVKSYLENKDAVRDSLAEAIGATRDQVKHCLLMLLNGASRSRKKSAAIPKELGSVEKAELLYAMPKFKKLLADIKQGSRVIISNLAKVRNKSIVNCLGLKMPRKVGGENARPGKIMSHILQGAEARTLMAALDEVGEVLVLIHDGFVTSKNIDIPAVERRILEETGFHMKIKPTRMANNADFGAA